MKSVTSFYNNKGTMLLSEEIEGILPISLQEDMRIKINEAEVKVSHWEYHLETTEQKFELRIFLKGKGSKEPFRANGQEAQVA